jgi:alpha-tubulin suppressor-like RCC1 family protein
LNRGESENKLERSSAVQIGIFVSASGNRFVLSLLLAALGLSTSLHAPAQVGDGTTTTRDTPVPANGRTNVVAVAAGYGHTLALLRDGTVRAWGYNFARGLGDGTWIDRPTPVQVKGPNGVGFLTDVVAVAARHHSLALLRDGTVRAWGSNAYGQLGDKTETKRATPVQVKGPNGVGFLTDVVAVAAGDYHSLALLGDGTARAWGWNFYGQLGDGTTLNRTTPVQVKEPNGVRTGKS